MFVDAIPDVPGCLEIARLKLQSRRAKGASFTAQAPSNLGSQFVQRTPAFLNYVLSYGSYMCSEMRFSYAWPIESKSNCKKWHERMGARGGKERGKEGRKGGRQADRQTDSDRQTDRQTDRGRERERYTKREREREGEKERREKKEKERERKRNKEKKR